MADISLNLRRASLAWLLVGAACAVNGGPTATMHAPVPPPAVEHALTIRERAFLDTLERRTFNWFWERTDANNGLTPDRWPTKSFSSIAAVGFALTAYPVGVERGYVSRVDAAQRALTTLRFLYSTPQGPEASNVTGYNGFFYHFLDMQTGYRFEHVELSTIDTSLLLGGVLFCQSYFTGADPTENAIRAYADSLYLRVNWPWAVHNAPLVSMGWHPESGFINSDWKGYDEGMIIYILALGSPTHPIDPASWNAWTQSYVWLNFYGQPFVNFPSLFGHQYSHVWIDFRGIQDAYMRGKGIDYFENSRRATNSQRSYAIDNPGHWLGYGPNFWGLTAVDGPHDTTVVINGVTRQFHTYTARGAAADYVMDDGTLAPTAPGGSVAFAPEIAVPALIAMREKYGDNLFTSYGFVDSYNPTFQLPITPHHGHVVAGVGWFDNDFLGIDQGPIVAMIENYRSDLIWKTMRKNPYIIAGLKKAGFAGGWLGN
jgi:hypothetical protein